MTRQRLQLNLMAASGSANFVVTLEESAISYTGGTVAKTGSRSRSRACLSTDDPTLGTGIDGRTVTFTLGSGSALRPVAA